MIVEHITLPGNTSFRDTQCITDEVRHILSPLQLKCVSKKIVIPELPFVVNLTAVEEGAIFDLLLDDQPVTVNVCCFKEEYSKEMFELLESLSDSLYDGIISPRLPTSDTWMYSSIVSITTSPEFLRIAGEVELYIYEQLYIAQK